MLWRVLKKSWSIKIQFLKANTLRNSIKKELEESGTFSKVCWREAEGFSEIVNRKYVRKWTRIFGELFKRQRTYEKNIKSYEMSHVKIFKYLQIYSLQIIIKCYFHFLLYIVIYAYAKWKFIHFSFSLNNKSRKKKSC